MVKINVGAISEGVGLTDFVESNELQIHILEIWVWVLKLVISKVSEMLQHPPIEHVKYHTKCKYHLCGHRLGKII